MKQEKVKAWEGKHFKKAYDYALRKPEDNIWYEERKIEAETAYKLKEALQKDWEEQFISKMKPGEVGEILTSDEKGKPMWINNEPTR